MLLKKLTLRNFRCFEHIELELHPRLNVLVAQNGGGKSAVLDAIALGLSPLLQKLSTTTQRLKGRKISDTDYRLIPCKYAKETGWKNADDTAIKIETDVASWTKNGTSGGEKELSVYAENICKNLTSKTPSELPVFAYYDCKRAAALIPKRKSKLKNNYSFRTSALIDSL
jgi:predicted ATP-binding protein involved in virulence